MGLKGYVLPVRSLSDVQRQDMFELMGRYYENVTWPTFSADLDEKRWVILLLAPESEAVVGFSTQTLLDVDVAGRPVKVLFSGDTIIAREHWGDTTLTHLWGRLALSLLDRVAPTELYWWLISKGYKTYRFLPLFFREFYPRHDRPTPEWVRSILEAAATGRYPEAYDAAAGVVRAGVGKDRLRTGVADLTAERLGDPHVRFFVESNPGHMRGDELCCLAPITRENFTRAAYRVIGAESRPIEVAP